MSFALLAHETLGTLWFPKLLDFNNAEPERDGEKTRSVTGATIHQVAGTEDSDREIVGTIICNQTARTTLLALYRDASNFILHMQDGEAAYKGYLKSLTYQANTRTGKWRYGFSFYVTEKLTA